MNCPHCNSPLPPEETPKFCPECGKPLSQGSPSPIPVPPPASPAPQAAPFGPAVPGGTAAGTAEAQALLKEMESMSVMQIICLVLMFIPAISLVGYVLLLVILFMSLSLTRRVKDFFDRKGHPAYSALVAGIRGKCVFLLWYSLLAALVSAVAIVVAVMAAGLFSNSAGGMANIATIGIGLVLLLFILATLYAVYAQIFCFVKLYTVKGALSQMASGAQVPVYTGSGAGLILGILALVILLAVLVLGGIMAAIALPAYAKYSARAKFTEVMTAVAPVKQQVELCIFDVGAADAGTYCATGRRPDKAQGQRGWDLSRSPRDYASRYVDSITVFPGGVIEAKAIDAPGLKGSTYIVVPKIGQHGEVVNWEVSTQSTCLINDLC